MADSGREEAAARFRGLARALRSASEQLRREEQEWAGDYTELIGEQADQLAHYLEEHEAANLAQDVENFARRKPLLFLGGCAVAGFALGRFLKATPVAHNEQESEAHPEASGAPSPQSPEGQREAGTQPAPGTEPVAVTGRAETTFGEPAIHPPIEGSDVGREEE